MTDAFVPGLYTTSAPADSVAGDWRIARWTPRVVHVDAQDEKDPQKVAVKAIASTLVLGEVATVADLAKGLASVPADTVLVWAGGERFADDFPKAWDVLSKVLTERTASGAPFAVVLAGSKRR